MTSNRDQAAGPATRERDLVCREVVELVTAYLEGALDASERALLEKHLAGCGHCSTYLEQIRQTVTMLQTQRANGLNPDAKERLLAQFRRWRADDA